MKASYFAASVVSLGCFLAMVGGCQTNSPNVKNTLGSVSAMVDASPDKVTKAARKAVEELKLTDITSTGTKLDGRVTARNAQNDLVAIDISQAGDNVSKVAIRIGATGDENASQQIIERTRSNLHWFGSAQPASATLTNVLGTYSAMVNSTPEKVTAASRKTVEEMKLTDISSVGTAVDGKVTAMTAQSDAVTIDIEQAGENVSKVSIRVGKLGDEAISKQIMDKIKGNL